MAILKMDHELIKDAPMVLLDMIEVLDDAFQGIEPEVWRSRGKWWVRGEGWHFAITDEAVGKTKENSAGFA